MFLALGQALVALVRTTGAINAIGRILFIVLLLLGLLGGTGILGDTMQVDRRLDARRRADDPVLGRAERGGVERPGHVRAIACVGYVVVFTFIGIRWFRWETRQL